MMHRKDDLFFVISLVLMTIIGIYLVNHYIHKQDLDNYLALLGDKISEMIPDREKEEFEKIYASFVKQVEDNEIEMEEVEELANNIIEIRKKTDLISAAMVREILPVVRVKTVKLPDIKIAQKVELEKQWKQLAKEFERSFKNSDSIRIHKLHQIDLKNHIKEQLKINSKISEVLGKNNNAALEKVKILEKEIKNTDVQQKLLEEMNIIKSENKKQSSKIIALDEMKKVIALEKERLEQELAKKDSVQTLN